MKNRVRPFGFSSRSDKTPFTASRPPTLVKKFAALLACFGLLIAPTSAFASGATLTHAMGEIVQAPLDLVLSPISAGEPLVKN